MCVFQAEEAACMKEMSKEGKVGRLSQYFQEDVSTLVRVRGVFAEFATRKWCCLNGHAENLHCSVVEAALPARTG